MPNTVGSLITDATQLGKRDAMHAAVISVTSKNPVTPGRSLKFDFAYPDLSRVVMTDRESSNGIADPFLENEVNPGEIFLMFLNPGSTGNLHHVFDINVTRNGTTKTIGPNAAIEKTLEILRDEIAGQKSEIAELRSEVADGSNDECSGCY